MGKGALGGENVAVSSTILNTSGAASGYVAHAAGTGVGVWGDSVNGVGVAASTIASTAALTAINEGAHAAGTFLAKGVGTTSGLMTGVVAVAGQSGGTPAANTDETGVYGFSDESGLSAGVWGDTIGGTGVVATGDWGLYATGRMGVIADVAPAGTAIYAFNGSVAAGEAPGGRAIYARAYSSSQIALEAVGKVRFSRSGRTSIVKGGASKSVTLAGVSTSSYVIATLQTNQSGVYVKAVVPSTNKFTIYLSKAATGTCYVGYLVIN
jgi:hypothetical protein